MNKFFILIIAVIILATVYLTFYVRNDDMPPPVAIEVTAPPTDREPVIPEPPPVQFPVPLPELTQDQPPEPLPELDDSDESVEQEFNELVGDRQFTDVLLFQTFIRNFVVIVDNLTADKLPQQYLFFRPPSGEFMVTAIDDETSLINPENYDRYHAFIRLVETIDIDRMINIYRYLYPLFQQAYEELGYPDSYFNDRLVNVIRHILQTPEVEGTIELVQPSVYYKFADPALESLSVGQKLLIRIGPENARLIKSRLGDLLEELTELD